MNRTCYTYNSQFYALSTRVQPRLEAIRVLDRLVLDDKEALKPNLLSI
jgi:hypothetical protein